MSKYIDMMLVEDMDGTPHVVTAPQCTTDVGYAVAFNGTMGTVKHRALMDPQSEEYAILSAMVPVYEADASYVCRWAKEQEDAA